MMQLAVQLADNVYRGSTCICFISLSQSLSLLPLQTRAQRLHSAADGDKLETPPEGYTSNSNKEVRLHLSHSYGISAYKQYCCAGHRARTKKKRAIRNERAGVKECPRDVG